MSNGRSLDSGAGRGSKLHCESAASAPRFEQVVRALSSADLGEAWRFWSGASGDRLPSSAQEMWVDLTRWAADSARLEACLGALGRRLESVLEFVLCSPGSQMSSAEIQSAKELTYLSEYDLQASVELLRRRALLGEIPSAGGRIVGVPHDLAATILRGRRAQQRGTYHVFTLHGHMDRLYGTTNSKPRMSPKRVREMYKMYSNEAAAAARVARLPAGLRDLVEKVLIEFGGILPRALFDRMDTELPHWNGRRWGRILEESLVGTVEVLDLSRFGVQDCGETVIVFNEVALAWLKRVAVPSDPDAPHECASFGVDLVSDISRFMAFVIENNVRFTVRGELFKTTEKRILAELISEPSRELESAESLSFIYRFTRDAGLIESTGERTLSVSAKGRTWEEQDLDAKLNSLFEYVVNEPGLGGKLHHEVRVRHIFLRLVKRVEPGVWYDIMYLPFLARNTYLCRLDELAVEEYDNAQTPPGPKGRGDDLQRMAWHLVGWVRRRLHLLGLVDLGYDRGGHPVAMRLTRVGARLLGMIQPETDAPRVGNLVITPDFEIVLFPSEDAGQLIHDLDRFCQRGLQEGLRHYSITESSLRRALQEGMSLGRIVETLELNSRTPVPQNVLYTIRSWANQAGLLTMTPEMLVRCKDSETLRRFVTDPGVKGYVKKVLAPDCVQLRRGISPARMRSLLRELAYLVEVT